MSHIHLCMFFFQKLSSSEPRHVKFTVSTSAGELFPCSPKASRQCRCLSTSSHEKKKESRSASNLWLIKQQTETNHSQIKSRIKGNLTFFCSLRRWFMIDLQMWTLRLCHYVWFLGLVFFRVAAHRLSLQGSAKCPGPSHQSKQSSTSPTRWDHDATGLQRHRRPSCKWRASHHDDGFVDEDHLNMMQNESWNRILIWQSFREVFFSSGNRHVAHILTVPDLPTSHHYIHTWLSHTVSTTAPPRNQNAWDQRLPLSHALITELHVISVADEGIKCPSSWSVCKACGHWLHSS